MRLPLYQSADYEVHIDQERNHVYILVDMADLAVLDLIYR